MKKIDIKVKTELNINQAVDFLSEPEIPKALPEMSSVNKTSANPKAKLLSDPISEIGSTALKDRIIEALRSVYDPEIPVNIYDLGLIYDITIDNNSDSDPANNNNRNQVHIQMTLTSPGCPVAQTFPQTVQDRILNVPDVSSATVELVWDPPWTKDRMSDAAKLTLDMF